LHERPSAIATTAAFFVQPAVAFGVRFLGALGGIFFGRSTRGSGCFSV
jgi:hypothetical protein